MQTVTYHTLNSRCQKVAVATQACCNSLGELRDKSVSFAWDEALSCPGDWLALYSWKANKEAVTLEKSRTGHWQTAGNIPVGLV